MVLILQILPPIRLAGLAISVILALLLAACGGGQSSQSADGEEQRESTTGAGQKYPDVVEVELEASDGDTWALAVTISSPYDSPERYADGWRVLDPAGTVLGEQELTHDHASEQPFTRSQTGLEIPQDVQEITVEGRDLKNGYGGETVTIPVKRG